MPGPVIPDIRTLVQAGINPKTGLPYKFKDCKGASKEDFKKILRIVDEQDAVGRYQWFNLPCDITSQELERMLYYKGQLAFFYLEDTKQFYFSPYALDGTIDIYGRFNTIHPVPMSNGSDENKKTPLAQYFATKKFDVKYGMQLFEDENLDPTKYCVLLHDYTKQLSQSLIPRQQINDPILDVMAECMPYMRTALIRATGTTGVRVPDADSAQDVEIGNGKIKQAALEGDMNVPITGALEFQELAGGQVAKAEEYMLAMQSLDNFRLGTYGIENGGLFEKKAHELQTEAAINGGPVGLVLDDGLKIRQNFCDIVNSLFGLGIDCQIAETISSVDINGDGLLNGQTENESPIDPKTPNNEDVGGGE